MAENTEPREAVIDEAPISPVRPNMSGRKDSLEKHLQHRPDPKDLIDRHILMADPSVAPSLHAAAVELERHRATDSLKKGLEHRPQREDLVERNILPESNIAPAIQSQKRELEKHMRADSLNEKLAHRPDPKDLVKEGILQEDPTEADKLYEKRIEEEYAKREGGA